MTALFKDTLTNLAAGLRLYAGQRPPLERFRGGERRAAILVLLALLPNFLWSLFDSLPRPEFNSYVLGGWALALLLALTALRPVARAHQRPLAQVLVVVFSLLPPAALAGLWLQTRLLEAEGDERTVLLVAGGWLLGWFLLALYRAATLLAHTDPDGRGAARAFSLLLVLWLLPVWLAGDFGDAWYPGEEPRREVRALDAEALMYAQPDLLTTQLATLAPGRPGVPDLYFLGFAGWAAQDVFRKEVEYARALFDGLGGPGRSLVLLNHPDTGAEAPLASATNLQRSLAHLGRLMDPEDVLVLYLTSHGGPEELAVRYRPLPLNPLTPERLRADLDAAAIPWRMLIVSACYSGGFVALADEHTAVATASAADRQSFGCSNTADFTYFGEALFRDGLARIPSLRAALEQALPRIAERERREGLTPSLPQLQIGSEMAAKLEQLDLRLACGSQAPASCR